jgi:protein arginine kinase activator
MLAFFHVFDYIRYVICAQCGEREALVFIRRRGGAGDGCDIVLCEACARERGIVAGNGGIELNFGELIGEGLERLPSRASSLRCPKCSMELSAVLRERRLGCPACAEAFSTEIMRALGRDAMPALKEEPDFFVPASSPESGAPRELAARLATALAGEEYEKAAALRDEISRLAQAPGEDGAVGHTANPFPVDFPLGHDSLFISPGPDDDVVLWTSAVLRRNLEGLPFPGTPGSTPAPSRSILLEKAFAADGWRSWGMAELGPAARRSLAERGLVPRSYAADLEAGLAANFGTGAFALLDEGDHLRLRAVRPGFDPRSALASALAEAGRIGERVPLARHPRLGWICARLSDCGTGASISALIHLPAITAAGLRDRLFHALMAEGAVIRGFYSTGEESSGSLYEIGVEPAAFPNLEAMVRAFSNSVAKAVQSERRARSEISEKGKARLADSEGRAFGTALYCSLLGAEEAASIVSTLRLAAIRGSLMGADPRGLAILLTSLGTATLAQARGLSEIPDSEEAESLRARGVKAALAKAEYTGMAEEGA